jgi:hypothetical protein
MDANAQARYVELSTEREPFLNMARTCAKLTLPYILTENPTTEGEYLATPWQSTGAKGVNVLAAKLMLSLFPLNHPFFKLQINDLELAKMPEVTPDMKSSIDLALGKMEKIVMEQIAETTDRVHLHGAMKHLVVTGNSLIYASKKNLKVYPLDRYVVNRDGNDNIQEIVTMEIVARKLLPKEFQTKDTPRDVNSPGEDGPKFGVATSVGSGQSDDAVVYTHVTYEDGQHKWHQECDGKIIQGSKSSSPLKTTPWMPITFNHVDGESYGRGRVEEFLGDLNSLERLMQALVEGSAAAAKVVFLVSPSATTKPQSLARAANGAIIQGRPDDVGVVQVGKTADFGTVQAMITNLTARVSEAFLIMGGSIRDSERTTAAEVNATAQELNEQLGGIYSGLTATLLQPYLARKLMQLQRQDGVPKLPKGLVMPTVVAGLNGIGRGQDRVALMEFMATVAQGIGPDAMQTYINPSEFLARLAAASGIEALGLIKTPQELTQEREQAQQAQQQQTLLEQAGQLSKSPMAEQMVEQNGQQGQQEDPPAQAGPPN